MTEEDAKTKDCPQLLGVMTVTAMLGRSIGKGVSEEIVDSLMAQGYCIASDCMMWVSKQREISNSDDKE